jgi:hypothetical protein
MANHLSKKELKNVSRKGAKAQGQDFAPILCALPPLRESNLDLSSHIACHIVPCSRANGPQRW